MSAPNRSKRSFTAYDFVLDDNKSIVRALPLSLRGNEAIQ